MLHNKYLNSLLGKSFSEKHLLDRKFTNRNNLLKFFVELFDIE